MRAGTYDKSSEEDTVILTAETAVTDEAALRLRVSDLEVQLHRERSRRKGVERGLEALSERLAELQRENAELRNGRARRFTRS